MRVCKQNLEQFTPARTPVSAGKECITVTLISDSDSSHAHHFSSSSLRSIIARCIVLWVGGEGGGRVVVEEGPDVNVRACMHSELGTVDTGKHTSISRKGVCHSYSDF